jgi:mannan endo-1,4-beta-mannosidase
LTNRRKGGGPSRRAILGGAVSATAVSVLPRFARAEVRHAILVADDRPGRPISPYIYGSNEIGIMDGGAPSAELDRAAGVRWRRLGGNLMTTYNWVNNAANPGVAFNNANGGFLLDALEIAGADRARPAIVVEKMHDASLAMGAASLATLPLAGFVAADLDGPVRADQAAPSPRFVETRWASSASADDAIDPRVADIAQLLRRLVKRYGDAASGRGISAYALDNEPALWPHTHPRLVRAPVAIRDHIERSLAAARIIKAIDPSAAVFGPVSWGATEMASFQTAPDWDAYRHYGSALAAYLDAFRIASERDGRRLLDALDIHWYAFSRRGDLFRAENPQLDSALLDAPRSLSEVGFREESWVAKALGDDSRDGLGLPILPSLDRLTEQWFPGTRLAVTEFNFGGAGRLAAGLAIADALGRFARSGVAFAAHWGSLDRWLGEAYRLYRRPDSSGAVFGDFALEIGGASGPEFSAYASQTGAGEARVVVINKGLAATAVDIAFVRRPPRAPNSAFGFDADNPAAKDLEVDARVEDGAIRCLLPGRSARRYAFT